MRRGAWSLGFALLLASALAEDVCEGPVVELQLEAQDGSIVETQYGVVGAFGAIPAANGSAPVRLAAASPLDACGPLAAPLDGAVAVARRGGCSFVDKYAAVLAAGGSALLMFNDAPGCVSMGGALNDTNGTSPSGAAIPAISIDHDLGLRLVNATTLGSVVLISIELLDLPPVDAGAALLWLMAVATVAGGAIWAGRDHAAAAKAAAAAADEGGDGRRGRGGGGGGGGAGGAGEVLDVTAAGAVGFVAVASGMLLLLYFFMSRTFFYVILFVFTLSAGQALALLLAAALAAAAPALAARSVDVPAVGDVPLPVLIAAGPALAAAAVWAVFRNAPWSWPLLDTLGIALMLLVLRTLRLGSLRVACVLLPLCFVYDVFFVFIQPAIFGGGDSVMVEVARGAGLDETLPMLLRVPRLSGPPIARGGYSMLGFGDVILPGLLVALTRRIDVDARLPWPRGYFLPALAAYGCGLVLTYVALIFSLFGDQGQPALLYIVPCTLGTVLGLAAWRGDLRTLWAADGGSGGGEGSGSWAALLGSGDEAGEGGRRGGGGAAVAEEPAAAAAADAAWRPALGGRRGSSGGGSGGSGSARSSPTASRARLVARGAAGAGSSSSPSGLV
ncbi:signal peptide peptidase-like [Raphidocelis subcapitata]|uniref:Signal peptide peptidase-like n=1 Tax=Raphidocelis subcapitata TaxID=307507 RepID=A0A2V0PIU2_9CHLO|nr:signal peptide peptidase-like [Raphidocelis subcapitata]|eukprot:GBF97873.1 signal peptide peptidase-like [Raphidocelis subcapitata]